MANDRKNKTLPGLRISEAAKVAGVSKQTIEYYIMLDLVRPVRLEKDRRTMRFFDREAIKRIKLVRRLNDSGYTLRDIRQTYLHRR